MSIIEIGALVSALLAIINLSGKVVKLITTIQSLINSINQLQVDMKTTKSQWDKTASKVASLEKRLTLVEVK